MYWYDGKAGINRKPLENEASLASRSADTGLELYRYDAFNRLSKYYSGSTEASYTYSADNLRHDKVVNNNRTEYVWNGQNLASETSGGNINTYTYDATGVYIANQNGTVSSYLKDNHGNVIGKTDATGTMMQAASELKGYDAYGNLRTGAVPDPFGYCGEYYDNETGLIYLRNRYYDSTKGIFITEDPAKDGLNWYSYCNGNPVMFSDHLGLAVTDWDIDHCTKEDLKKLEQNTKLWINGDDATKEKAAAQSKAIRTKYITDSENLLDNGFIVSSFSKELSGSALNGSAIGVVTIDFDRIYSDRGTTVVLKKIKVYTIVGERVQTSKMSITTGCVYGTGNQREEITVFNQNNYEQSFNWTSVPDDRGAGWTTVEAAVDFTFVKGNDTERHTITIINNVYDEYFVDESGNIIDQTDPLDILIEVLQRGER